MRQAGKAVAAEHYVQRLDLGMDPFVEGFQSDYFYPGAQRKQLVEQALHFSRFSDQVVLLVGSTGSGTSTILDQLLDQLEPVMDFCSLDAESVSAPEQILNTLTDQLQLGRINTVPEFIAELRHVESMDASSEPLLIAVDQAHFMGMEGLELLGQLYTQAAGAIHLLLVGEYQVEQLLKLTGFEAARLKVLELEPLDAEATGEYLLGLLHSVGYAGEQPLSADQLAVLHEQSGGNIAEINLLVPKLLNAEAREAKPFQFAMPVSHIAAVAVLLIAIGFSYWYESGQSSSEAETPMAAAANVEGVATGAADEEQDPVARTAKPVDIAAVLQQSDGVASAVEASEKPPAPEKTALQSRSVSDSTGRGAEEVLNKELTKEESAQSTSDQLARASEPTEPSVQSGSVERALPQSSAKPAIKLDKERSAVEASGAVVTAKTSLSKPAETVVEKRLTQVQQPAAKTAEVKAPVPQREQRLLSMNSSGYVLQLMGAVEEERAQKMVAAYAGRLPVTYYETRRKDKPWYVVVTGPYESKTTARAGRDVLPAELKRQQPWPRSVAGVQDEIRSHRF